MTSIESARAVYARARKERFALGAFNVDNQETLIAIARAAAPWSCSTPSGPRCHAT